MTIFLTLEDLLVLVDDLGVGPVRDVGLLDSAAHRPSSVVFGKDVYPSIDAKAAALLESLVKIHTLVDGNKRLGWLAVVVFYGLNEIMLEAPDDDVYNLVIDVASGEIGYEDAARVLATWY